jgi:hypothetical protein
MSVQPAVNQPEKPAENETSWVWAEFVAMLQTGQVASIRISPYHSALLDPIRGILANMSRSAEWQEWAVPPEVHRVEQQVHFVLDLTLNHDRDTYCFSFLLEDGAWYFQHVESITLCLDQLGPLPTRRFPDLPEQKKAWMREEIRVTEMVRLYQWLVNEKGQEFALNWFLDGEGYVLAARSWVPFVPVYQAFILYLCWEQSNLRGSQVTLIELGDEIARVEIDSMYFHLYHGTGHLKRQFSFEEYRKLFEANWIDRAEQGGWNVAFAFQNGSVQMVFQRK